MDRTDRRGIRRAAAFCRWEGFFFLRGREDHGAETGPKCGGFGDELAGERLHGITGGGWEGVLFEDQDSPVSNRRQRGRKLKSHARVVKSAKEARKPTA